MKYLVILDFTESKNPPPVEQVDLCTATCHDSLNDANKSINILTTAKAITMLKKRNTYPRTEYSIKVLGKYDGVVRVVAYPDDMVFYDITVKDFITPQEITYRYTRLDLVLDFVNRSTGAVGELRFKLPFGLIISDDYTMTIKLDLDIVDKQEMASTDDDYELIGASDNMSKAEIKQAYHKKILVVHPDRGGKEEDFLQVQQAYERIKNGTPHRKRKQVKTMVIRSYTCKDPASVLSRVIDLEYRERSEEAAYNQRVNGYMIRKGAWQARILAWIIYIVIGLIVVAFAK